MQSSKAVQLPATSGRVVHAIVWKPAMENLNNWGISSRHGQEQLLCFYYVLCSSVGAENFLGTSESPPSPDCSGSGAVPKCPMLGSVSLCHRTRWWLDLCQPCESVRTWTQDAAWLTEKPKARVFTGQDYFSPVWLSLHCMIRWHFPLFLNIQFHCAL